MLASVVLAECNSANTQRPPRESLAEQEQLLNGAKVRMRNLMPY